MELLVKPEILTSYIYMLSCGTVVCKHFASFHGLPNYRWDLIRYIKGWEETKLLVYRFQNDQI
jgi:hypothetical protein